MSKEKWKVVLFLFFWKLRTLFVVMWRYFLFWKLKSSLFWWLWSYFFLEIGNPFYRDVKRHKLRVEMVSYFLHSSILIKQRKTKIFKRKYIKYEHTNTNKSKMEMVSYFLHSSIPRNNVKKYKQRNKKICWRKIQTGI